MNAKQWWDEVGTDVMNELVDAVETNTLYFYHIAAGRKTPGRELAVRMATESLRISGIGMTVDSLLKMDHLPVEVIVGDRAAKV